MTNVFSENQIEMLAVLESEQRDAEQAMREAAIRYGEAEPLAEMQLLQAADRYAQARRAAISLMQ